MDRHDLYHMRDEVTHEVTQHLAETILKIVGDAHWPISDRKSAARNLADILVNKNVFYLDISLNTDRIRAVFLLHHSGIASRITMSTLWGDNSIDDHVTYFEKGIEDLVRIKPYEKAFADAFTIITKHAEEGTLVDEHEKSASVQRSVHRKKVSALKKHPATSVLKEGLPLHRVFTPYERKKLRDLESDGYITVSRQRGGPWVVEYTADVMIAKMALAEEDTFNEQKSAVQRSLRDSLYNSFVKGIEE